MTELVVLNQHLIDPEVCIRCNTCEESCPIDAITHDSNNYVVKADTCNACMACVAPCPTGAIDNWRKVLKTEAYSVEEQLGWMELPAEKPLPDTAASEPPRTGDELTPPEPTLQVDTVQGSRVPPWSAAHPYLNLYTHKAPITATVAGNYRLTADGTDHDVRHLVLDFGNLPFPVLEGQSIAVIPPGTTADGRAHHGRQYSVASPRNGERPGYNNLSLTVKRVSAESGSPAGVCSNYLCDLKRGDKVQVTGPYGASFLMPNHPGSNLLMICTGTGSAPMRAMTEWRRRLREKYKQVDKAAGSSTQGPGSGRLMLFFGARTQEELPYFGPLTKLPKDFIDTTFAFSRVPGQPKRYVQDALRERAVDVADLLKSEQTYIYVCGVKGMEEGVLSALADVAAAHSMAWQPLWERLKVEGRLHLETY